MSEQVEARARRAPFLWLSSRAFRALIMDLPRGHRQTTGWIYTCLAATASDAFDGTHEGFVSTAEQVLALSGVSLSTFKRAVRDLERLGLLRREERRDERGGTLPNRYILLEPGGEVTGGRGAAGEVSDDPPNARGRDGKKEEALVPTGRERTRGRAVSYQGRRVPAATVDAAETLLAVFNEAEGRSLGAWTGSGKASPSLKQIIGALLIRDHVTVPEWERAIRAVSANPPDWCDGTLQLGHIFGERAAEYALANDGTRRENGKRRSSPGMSDFAQIALGDG